MPEKEPFDILEKRGIRDYFADGVLDLMIGWGLLIFGFYLATGWYLLSILSWLIPISLVRVLKNLVAVPRQGFVRFREGATRPIRRRMIITILLTVVLLSSLFGLEFASRMGSLPASIAAVINEYIWMLAGFSAAVILGAAGVLLGLRAYFGYAILTGVIFLVAEIIDLPPEYPYLIVGGSITLLGGAGLWRFVRQNPPIEPEDGFETG